MKKLITSIGVALCLIKPVMPAPLVTETAFESVLYASKKTGDLMPVWEQFINTQFFVVINRNDSGPTTKDFRFAAFNNPVDKKPYVLISEYLERLENVQNGAAINLSGAELVQLLQPGLGIVIGLSAPEMGGFVMPNEQV